MSKRLRTIWSSVIMAAMAASVWPSVAAACAFMFTLDGAPMLYNGMEVGDTAESGAPALFEKMPILRQIAERRPEFPRFYKRMIARARLCVAALWSGCAIPTRRAF